MRLSVDFWSDDKIQQLTHSEQILYQKMVAWSSKHQTDGCVPWSALRTIAAGHRNVPASLDKMILIELLRCDTTETPQQQRYNITAFPKWQMNTDSRKPKPAGQSVASRGYVGTPAGIENRTDLDISLSEDSLPPAEPVKDPRLIAALDRIGKQLENGQGH